MKKVAVITGGTGGLGKAVCERFIDADYSVVTTYRVDEELRDLLESLGEKKRDLDAYRIDVTNESSLEELAHHVRLKYHHVDALVCLVGGFASGTLTDEAGDTFNKLFTLNTRSFLLSCNAIVPLMKNKKNQYTHIVGVAAKPALEPTKNLGIYAASKTAVVSLVKTLALELLEDNITVNAIAPSTIDTPANRKAMPKVDPKRWVTAEQLANSLLFLCSENSNVTTGTVLPVYGKA